MARGDAVRRIVQDEIDRVLSNPVALPERLKQWLPRYLEVNQPNLFLSQTQGWKAHIGSNTGAFLSSQATLTTTAAALAGTSVTLQIPGTYIINGSFVFKAGAVNYGSPSYKNVAGPDAKAWTSPGNAAADDGSDTTAAITSGAEQTDYLNLYSLGLLVPAGAVATGVKVTVQCRVTSSTATIHAQLTDSTGALTGTEQTSAINATMTDYTFGGIGNLLGATISEATGEDADFGVSVWGTAAGGRTFEVDYLDIEVYWNNTGGDAAGQLYVGGVEQSGTAISNMGQTPSGGQATAAYTWFVSTSSKDQAAQLYAKKDQNIQAITAETSTGISVFRIS